MCGVGSGADVSDEEDWMHDLSPFESLEFGDPAETSDIVDTAETSRVHAAEVPTDIQDTPNTRDVKENSKTANTDQINTDAASQEKASATESTANNGNGKRSMTGKLVSEKYWQLAKLT